MNSQRLSLFHWSKFLWLAPRLIEKVRSDQVPRLIAQLAESQQQIERLHIKLANLSTDSEPQPISTTEATADSDVNQVENTPPAELLPPEPETPPHLIDAISTLVSSMSQLTHKFDLFLDRGSFSSSPPSGKTQTTPPPPTKRAAQTIALLNHVIDLMIAHNNQATDFADQWFICISILKQVSSSQSSVTRVINSRKSELDSHHSHHGIGRLHNRSYHQGQQLQDFFSFD